MGEFPTLVQYRNGQHLTSSLFRMEQEFHRSLLERHAIAAHEWGIAAGLELSAEAVAPGLAYDGFGRPLALATRAPVPAAAYFDLYDVTELDVALVYSFSTEPTSDVIVEQPFIQLVPADHGADRRAAPPNVPLAQGFDASGSAPHDLTHPWPVYLGTLSRDPSDPNTPVTVNLAGRPYIGVRAARVIHPDDGYELDLRDGVSVGNPSLPVLSWVTRGGQAEVRTAGPLVTTGDVTARGVELTASPPADPMVAWSLQRIEDGGVDEFRVVFGEDSDAKPSRFVIGATVDGTFKPMLTVESDGTVTVGGNLVVTGDLTVGGQVSP